MANNTDTHVDELLDKCISEGTRSSFFLFAGAGSGKTHSLVTLLNSIRAKWETKLTKEGRHVAVITYTNAATDEIISRLDYSPLFHVSTIHSFIWDVIKPYQTDIKRCYQSFRVEEKTELSEKIAKARTKNKTYESNIARLEYIEECLTRVNSITKFTYNPNGNNSERNALSHADVIKIGAKLIIENRLLQQIIAQQYPFFLIDESQDTKKELVNAFFEIQKNYSEEFTLGLLGDHKQRIYTDGEERIVQIVNDKEWEKPVKRMNYRCDKRIVQLANRIGGIVDELAEQDARTDAEEGYARLFLIKNGEGIDKKSIEDSVKATMVDITGDEGWNPVTGIVKTLALEHMMAARRLGFNQFLQAMRQVNKYSQTIYQGKISDMDVFTHLIFPLIQYVKDGDNFNALKLLKENSPLLKDLPHKDAYGQLEKVKELTSAVASFDLNEISIKELLLFVFHKHLFEVPSLLIKASELPLDAFDPAEDANDEVFAWASVMELPAIQVKLFDDYTSGRTMFDTHQGVKGLEFDRVQVIIDEKESKTFLFNYDKLMGVKPLSDTDVKNMAEGKETSIERTTRLFYVVCTRAKHSLAITMYTDDPDIAKSTAIEKGWFSDDEIIIVNA